MLLSIVFSFRNEEKVLSELINRVGKVLEPLGIEYELIFVNDNSSDSSLELLEKHRANNKAIKIINMSRRFGVAPCIMAGLRHARGDVVICMEADLQDPPELIPILLEKWKDGAEVVHTTRTVRKEENVFKLWLTKQAYRIINFVADIDIPEDTGDFKLLSRRAVNEVIRLNEYDPFLRGLIKWIGFKQARVFYEREPRFAGISHRSLGRSAAPIREFIRGLTSFSSLPLYFALLMGFLVLSGAFIYLIFIITRLFLGIHLPGWPAIMVTMLFLGGTILFAIGVLGIYIGRIYQDIKKRPPYIIESKVGIDEDTTDNRKGP